jgi:hypothetical protein
LSDNDADAQGTDVVHATAIECHPVRTAADCFLNGAAQVRTPGCINPAGKAKLNQFIAA